jgi:hypothetical protein
MDMLALDRNFTGETPVIKRRRSFSHTGNGNDADMEVLDMCLLSGGRWLLCLTSEALTLWDLDHDILLDSTLRIVKLDEEVMSHHMSVDTTEMPAAVSVVVVTSTSECVSLRRFQPKTRADCDTSPSDWLPWQTYGGSIFAPASRNSLCLLNPFRSRSTYGPLQYAVTTLRF